MSKWPGKTVIGLTGNIATGKSVVRRMLEHLGAYTIDADSLSHRAISVGAPGYQPVVEAFGKWVLAPDRSIDRSKLGRLVFDDPSALQQLEAIIHPLVGQAIDMVAQRASQKVVVIEAIKLLESDLLKACDTVWVVDAPESVQVNRLMRKRGLTREAAERRVRIQPPQGDKLARADVIIRNTGSYEALWTQVTAAWKKLGPAVEAPGEAGPQVQAGDFSVQRGRPRDAAAIAELITRLSNGRQAMDPEDVMAAFGDRAFLILRQGKALVGLAGWQVENLVARTSEVYLAPQTDIEAGLELLIGEVERLSQDLQCEASLVFIDPGLAAHPEIWKRLGYDRRTPEKLGVQAWQDAAQESMVPGATLLFKQLRQDRILRPI